MASKIVILVLLLVAIVGMASAAEPAKAAVTPVSGNDDAIGNTDDSAAAPGSNGNVAVAAPIGSAEDAKAHAGAAQAPGSNSASTLGVSAAAGAAAIAGYFVL